MRDISVYFFRMPRKVVREFAILIDGEIVSDYHEYAEVEKVNNEFAGSIYMSIEFDVDCPDHILDVHFCEMTHIFEDKKAGMRIYEKMECKIMEKIINMEKIIKMEKIIMRGYIVLLQEPLTPLQAYKAYRICENLTYASAKHADFWSQVRYTP